MTESSMRLVEVEGRDVPTVSRADAQRYEKYERWYKNEDGLFGKLGKFLVKEGAGYVSRVDVGGVAVTPKSSVENLRNPVHRIVEFHATTILSGLLEDALSVEDGKDKLKEAVLKVWEWSNLSQRIRVAKRYLARDGQVFEKVVRPEGKGYCYVQFVPAKHVTDFDTDERGNATFVRIDVPDVRTGEDGRTKKVWRTEVWRKGKTNAEGEVEPGYALFAVSERTSSASVPSEKALESKGTRVELGSERGYKFDFVPFVVVNAQDTGEKRPEPVYAHGLQLVAWICKEATRLSDLMFRFNKAFKVIFGMGNDPNGRPMAPPKPGNVRDLGQMHQESQAEHTVPMGGSRGTVLNRDEDISIEGIAVTGLPGNAQMADATPNIDYEAARQWISDHLREAYEELPELLYYAVESRANQSGAALRTLIAGAINRAEEMQSNLVAGLAKADKMALTIAQLEDFEGFAESEIGTYENGDFDHEIEPPEIMPLSDSEREEVRVRKIASAQALVALGVPRERALEEVDLDLGELAPDPEGGAGGDEVAQAAAALARRSGGDAR